MTFIVTTAPNTEPVTTAEVKTHLRIDHALDDAYIVTLIALARQYVEDYTRRALFTQTITAKYDRFSSCFLLERPMLQSVTSIAYIDTAGSSQTLATANYTVDIASTPARITLAYGYTWPSTRDITNAVTIVYVAGWATTAAIPPPLRHALLMMVGHWYENRESVVNSIAIPKIMPFAVQSLLDPYRVY